MKKCKYNLIALVLLISSSFASEYYCNNLIKRSPEYILLELAYKYKSSALRETVFSIWSVESRLRERNTKITNNDNESIQEIFNEIYRPSYESYNEFVIRNYNAKEDNVIGLLTRRSRFDIDDRMELFNFAKLFEAFYKDAKYLVLQDSINYMVYNDSTFNKLTELFYEEELNIEKSKSLLNVYKSVSDSNKIVLYLDNFHNCLLNEYIESSTDSLISEKDKYSSQIARREFISTDIQLSRFHWGKGWYYISFPDIYLIKQNESKNKVIIEMRDSWSSGRRVYLERNGNQWILDSRRNVFWNE